jgi:RimJ/RimL family protein N-acetyltransferase
VSAPAVAEIRTERLTLRPIELGDVASFAHMLADPEVVRFISDGGTATEEETAEWIAVR